MDDGLYYASILDAVTATATTGRPQMAIRFSITHQAEGNGWKEICPQDKYIYLTLDGAAMPYSEQKLEALGFNGDFERPVFESANGVNLTCRHETYEGKSREKWELADWGGGREPEPAGADVIRKLNALWKAKREQAARKPTGQPQRPAPPAPPPADPGMDFPG